MAPRVLELMRMPHLAELLSSETSAFQSSHLTT